MQIWLTGVNEDGCEDSRPLLKMHILVHGTLLFLQTEQILRQPPAVTLLTPFTCNI